MEVPVAGMRYNFEPDLVVGGYPLKLSDVMDQLGPRHSNILTHAEDIVHFRAPAVPAQLHQSDGFLADFRTDGGAEIPQYLADNLSFGLGRKAIRLDL
jgi:hypothetical protein